MKPGDPEKSEIFESWGSGMYHLVDCVGKREVQACNFSLLEGGVLHPDRTMENTHDLLYILEGGWEAVSYTHLDVYKRQALTRWSSLKARGFMTWENGSSRKACPRVPTRRCV